MHGSAVYRRIFDDVFLMTPEEKRIHSRVFVQCFGGVTPDVSIVGPIHDS